MEREVKIGIAILVLTVLLLGITFLINETSIMEPWRKPLLGNGLGPLCSDFEDCQEFCNTNFGICESYCNANPANLICNQLLGERE